MNASFKNSAAGQPSQTKNDFDDERKNTLPRGSAVHGQTTLAEASVMWDGPSPSGEGSRSEVLTHQGTIPSFAAAPVYPDAKHKKGEATHAQPSVSSSKWMSLPAQSANDAYFDSDRDSSARQLHVQQWIDQAPEKIRPYLLSRAELLCAEVP